VIPAEAVEAAAKAAFARTHPHGNFRLAIRELQDRYLSEARAALEAAAPYMLAEAWEEGYTLGYADCANKQESNRPNPYMLNNEGEK
jgi:hypothetical protein